MQLQTIQEKIYHVRGQRIMLDFDLAEMYEVETRVLNQAVKRNLKRFPSDFMFRLEEQEWKDIRSSQIVMSSTKNRGNTYLPYAFTEQGLAMLSGVLNSNKAIDVNIAIMRAFILLREHALTYKGLTDKLKKLESRYDEKFHDIYEAINFLINDKEQETERKERKRIGYK